MTQQLDPVKQMIAQAVQHHMVSDPHDRPALLPHPEDVESVEGTVVDALNTQIRVKTHRHGIRYFTVKVTEHW
jgi:hypothetical protein